jgi:hypothetical protein
VYFSTLGPASYGIGSESYEKNIIIDCKLSCRVLSAKPQVILSLERPGFGKERVEEYVGKNKLDLIIVYGLDPSILTQAPGGRDNAKVVSKATFETFTLPHVDGSFFLRRDRIMGMFLYDPEHPPTGYGEAKSDMMFEKIRDDDVKAFLAKRETDTTTDTHKVRSSLHRSRNGSSNRDSHEGIDLETGDDKTKVSC